MTQPVGDLVVDTGRGSRRVRLDDFLSAEAIERAESSAIAWIKALRHARVDGASFRDRFTHRGDSLWWFAELYLHKRQVIVRALRAIAAFEALLADGRPAGWAADGADPVVDAVAAAVAAREGLASEARRGAVSRRSRAELRVKAAFHTGTAWIDRMRPAQSPPTSRPVALAFVHSAFWSRDRGQESYLGPVLTALGQRLPDRLALVGVGPRTNFRVRRWRDRLVEFGDPAATGLPLTPIESYAGWRALAPSRQVWSERDEHLHALASSEDVRAHAIVEGVDLWPLVREELAGIADLQFPWSARAMDEAGAALDAYAPRVVTTYAEAGGWGRAIVLECRRRGIPSVGVQHGFIYRHWLNYRHAADEMAPSPANPDDRGFPRPTRTLLFDGFAAAHLRDHGAFPEEALAVTGSPSLERFVSLAASLDDRERSRIRTEAGVRKGTHLVLVAAKHVQLGGWFAALVRATADAPDMTVVVKPHPAEGPDPYVSDAAGAAHVRVASPSTDLARLTAVARVIVTANSTAAIEAMAVDVPALVVGLPNNLSPFVEAGAMAGVSSAERLGEALAALVRDETTRAALADCRRAFVERYGIVQPPGAADRAAGAIAALAIVD